MKKWLSLAASVALVASFTACNDNDEVAGVSAKKVEFIGMDAPSTHADMSRAYSDFWCQRQSRNKPLSSGSAL